MSASNPSKVVRVSRKGEVVIPAKIRRDLGLEKGGRLMLEVVGGKLVLEPVGGVGTQLWGRYQAAPGTPSSEQVLRDLDEAGEI